MFFGGFSGSKLKTNLKMAIHRINLLNNKKDNEIKKQKKAIAMLLRSGKEEKARIKVEHVIRDDFTMEANELIELLCETVVARLPLIVSEKHCPFDMVSAISTLIYVAPRVLIVELREVKKQLVKKYGKEFAQRANSNVDQIVNERIIQKLSCQPPSAVMVNGYLTEIAKTFKIKWAPRKSVASMGPMPTPTGYSVQPSPGAGFNNLYNQQQPGGQVPPMPPGPGGWGAQYAQPPPYGGPHGGATAGHAPAAGFPPPPGAGFPQPPAPKQDIPDAPNNDFPAPPSGGGGDFPAPPGSGGGGFPAPPGSGGGGFPAPPGGGGDGGFQAPPGGGGGGGGGFPPPPGAGGGGFPAPPGAGGGGGGFTPPSASGGDGFPAPPGSGGGGFPAPPGSGGGGFPAPPGSGGGGFPAPPGSGGSGFPAPPGSGGGGFPAPPGSGGGGFPAPPSGGGGNVPTAALAPSTDDDFGIPSAPTDIPSAPTSAPAPAPAPAAPDLPAPPTDGDDVPDFDELTRRFNELRR